MEPILNYELNYEGFEKYFISKNELMGGIQYVFHFDNGYGASVAKDDFSYGHEDDLWELAVLRKKDHMWIIEYGTHITDDVIGRLENEKVLELLKEIKELR